MLDAGLAQVHVHVDEAGRHHHARRIHHLGAGELQTRAHSGDASVFQRQVRDGVESRRRIDNAAVLN